jgi:thioredoxin 1
VKKQLITRIALIAALVLAVVVVVAMKSQRADSEVQRPVATAPVAAPTPTTMLTQPSSPSPTPAPAAATAVKPGELCPPTPTTTAPGTAITKPTTTKPTTTSPVVKPESPATATPSVNTATTPTTQAPVAKALPRMLDLGSTTCKPCIMMVDVMNALRTQYSKTLQVEFIDINENRDAASQYGIRAIPTQIFFDADGKEIFRHEGYYPKDDIVAKFKELGIVL